MPVYPLLSWSFSLSFKRNINCAMKYSIRQNKRYRNRKYCGVVQFDLKMVLITEYSVFDRAIFNNGRNGGLLTTGVRFAKNRRTVEYCVNVFLPVVKNRRHQR